MIYCTNISFILFFSGETKKILLLIKTIEKLQLKIHFSIYVDKNCVRQN